MSTLIKVVLFSEINSLFGYLFLQELLLQPSVVIAGLVTSPDGQLCVYYLNDPLQVNLKKEAIQFNIPVLQPWNINDETIYKILNNLNADYFLIANYQKILKYPIINTPRIATINFHPSLLPAYAGLAPFFWMAKQGETCSGVSAIRVNEQIDGGDILAQLPIKLQGIETASEIRETHFQKSLELLKEIMPLLIQKKLFFQAQNFSQRRYFSQPTALDFLIDWNASLQKILCTVRAGYRYPGAFTITEKEEKCTILSAASIPLNSAKLSDVLPGSVHLIGKRWVVCARDGFIHIKTLEMNEQEIELNDQILLTSKKFQNKKLNKSHINQLKELSPFKSQHKQAILPWQKNQPSVDKTPISY